MEQGRRLENLSWRLWNREIQCCEAGQTKDQVDSHATSVPKDIPSFQMPSEMPQLSGSVESAIEDDEEVDDLSSELEPVDIYRPAIVRHDSCASSQSRGRERHITSENLERMVVSIIQEREPNLNPLPEMSSPSLEPESEASGSAFSSATQDIMESPATPATEPLSHSMMEQGQYTDSSELASSANTHNTQVIRGFSPSQIPIPSLRIMSQDFSKVSEVDAIPEPLSSPAHKPVQLRKKPAKFALGGSSGDESSPSLETRQAMIQQPKKKTGMFSIGESSASNDETPSLKSAMHSARPNSLLSAQKKQTSFSNQVTTRTIQTPSDQSDSYMDESAIDDDDEDSDWEDSIEESGKSSMDDPVTFKRVPSKPNLTSQRSLISLMFAGQEQQNGRPGLGNLASQSTSAIPQQRSRTYHNAPQMVASPNDSDDHLEMKRGLRRTPLRPINEIPRSSAQPILATGHSTHQAALSPRTTRRNMLATELTESLRRHLLWERQHKSSTANAVLKRRHTSHDVANLKQYPEKSYMGKDQGQATNDEVNASSWNQYLERADLNGYHAQGW